MLETEILHPTPFNIFQSMEVSVENIFLISLFMRVNLNKTSVKPPHLTKLKALLPYIY